MCRRQPKKILLPPELPVFLAEPVELRALLAGEQTLVPGTGRGLVNTALPQPAGQAAGRKAKALSNNIAGEALLQTERNGIEEYVSDCRPWGRPPSLIASKPRMPVGAFRTPVSERSMASPAPRG